ncbi:MAG: GlsB/YeaQ/YmgE family stress response membrane protein [Actinomycetota bacterium]|nr:GlsB/YeaQ/YmgE family stress response membrane protein [Actinomycetota bacterium]
MDISEIIFAIILGAIAGFVARALLPGKQSMGLVLTILLGIAGAFVGYLIFTELLGIGDDDALDFGGIIGAIIGAMILLFIYERTVGASHGTSAPTARRGDRDRR